MLKQNEYGRLTRNRKVCNNSRLFTAPFLNTLIISWRQSDWYDKPIVPYATSFSQRSTQKNIPLSLSSSKIQTKARSPKTVVN